MAVILSGPGALLLGSFFFIKGFRVASTARSLATCWNFLFIFGRVVGSPVDN